MENFHRSARRIAVLAGAMVAVAAAGVSAAPPQPQGVVVVSDGSTTRSYAPAYEYTSLRFADGSFGLTLADGKKVAGLERHIVANFEYSTPTSVGAVAEMEALTRDHVKTAPYLSPRIVRMKEELRKKEFDAAIAGTIIRKPSSVLAAEMEVKGRTFRNIRATILRDGRLRFMHDEGAFSLAAEKLPEAFLLRVAETSPQIAETADFRKLLTTFVNRITIGGETHTGARIEGRLGEMLTIETGRGLKTVEASAIDPADLAELESAHRRFVDLTGSFREAREKEAKNLAAEIARLEREELDRYRRQHEAIAGAQGMADVESKIIEEFEKQRGAAGNDEAALLMEMGKILGLAKSPDHSPAAAPSAGGE